LEGSNALIVQARRMASLKECDAFIIEVAKGHAALNVAKKLSNK
jgi:hypothetical protein